MSGFKESNLQQNCVKWFDLQHPKLKMNLFSIPNEGARTPANGARMKAMGRRAGVADMFLAIPKHDVIQITPAHPLCSKQVVCNGAFIEFKFGKGKQGDNQKKFQAAVEATGYKYAVISCFDDFKKLIEEYLK